VRSWGAWSCVDLRPCGSPSSMLACRSGVMRVAGEVCAGVPAALVVCRNNESMHLHFHAVELDRLRIRS
jgi:hypothetical protein